MRGFAQVFLGPPPDGGHSQVLADLNLVDSLGVHVPADAMYCIFDEDSRGYDGCCFRAIQRHLIPWHRVHEVYWLNWEEFQSAQKRWEEIARECD